MKSIPMMTLMLFVALLSGCASLDMNTESGGQAAAAERDIHDQLADNSQGK